MQLPPFKQPASGDMVGAYRLLAKLGDGGQGLVFKAECAGRFFVLKFFRARELDAWGLTEVSLLQKFTHAHIVRVLGYGRWPDPELGYFYIAMEWVEGVTLEQYALEENPSARTCARLMRRLACTLAAVHRKRVLHRDVKRDNILIRTRDGEPVLVDFGIGNATEATPVPGSGLLPPGTQEYVSPEAWRFLGENVGEPVSYTSSVSDELWALGVTFYWLLTQRLPFGTRRNPFMVKAILSVTPLAPHECNPRVPKALSNVCMRMLEKDLAARLPDMNALDEALESALAEAQEDAAWDVPLGDPDAPQETTTDEIPGQQLWDEQEQAVRRCAAPPRRGRKKLNAADEDTTPVVQPPCMPQLAVSPAPVAEALAARMAALFPSRAWEGAPQPGGEGAATLLPVLSSPPRSVSPVGAAAPRQVRWRRAVSWSPPAFISGVPVRSWALEVLRRATWLLLVVGGVLVTVLVASHPENELQHAGTTPPGASSGSRSMLQSSPDGELAILRESSQAREGAAPSSAPIPALGLTPAMLRQEELSVNLPKNPPSPVKRVRWAEKCITAVCCAALGGCTGSTPQVRPVARPEPEDCPANALRTMEGELNLKLHTTLITTLVPGDPRLVTVRAGDAAATLWARFGELDEGTVLTGKFILGKDRLYGRFTRAQTPRGKVYPVCMQVVGELVLGVSIKADVGTDAVKVLSAISVDVTDRFK